MFRGSLGQTAKAAELPETIAPQENPKTTEYSTNVAVVSALFKQQMAIPVITPASASMFNRPNLSASTPWMIRPNVAATLRIASKYEASAASMPLMTAYAGMKNSGVNMPRNMKNTETIRRMKFASLKAAPMKKVVVLGGRRDLTVTHEKAKRGNMTSPMTRTVHPNPREELFSIFDNAIGMTTPPMDDPDKARPKAVARFLSKYCDTAAIAGNIRRPMAMPIRTPCVSMNCQYS